MFKTTLVRNSLLCGLFILTTLLTACGGQNSVVTCGVDMMQAVANLAPQNVVVDASKPVTLSWTNSDPNCQPTYYEVTLGTAHDGSTPGTTQTSQVTALNWPEMLQPGNTYFWTVYPIIVANGQTTRGPGQLGYFFTGPTCMTDAVLSAPRAITPPNQTPFDGAATITLRWDDPTVCLPDGTYSVQVAKTPDFSTVLYASQTGHITELTLVSGWTTDVVQDCAQYFWRVRAETSTGNTGPWSETSAFIINNAGSACGLLEVSPTPSPLPTETATPLPETPLGTVPYLTANENVNCRYGPAIEYQNADTLFKNWSQYIRGRNEDRTWWYIHRPNMDGYCWVWGKAVTVFGDTEQVPVVTPPPLPTESPVPGTATPKQ